MGLAHQLGKTIGHALAPVRAGDEGLAWRVLAVLDRRTLGVTSSAFTDGGSLPLAFLPAGTRSMVLVAEDPDAPTPKPFVHWLVYGIPTSVSSLQGAQRLEGKNSMLAEGFTPAAPPAGHR